MSNMDHISAEEMKQDAPLLSQVKKKEIEEPQGYFDELSDEVLTKLNAPVHEIYKVSTWSYAWKIAAGIFLLVGLFFLFKPSIENPTTLLSSNEIEIDIDSDLDYLLEIEDDIFYDALAEYEDNSEEEDIDARIEFLLEEDFDLDDIINL